LLLKLNGVCKKLFRYLKNFGLPKFKFIKKYKEKTKVKAAVHSRKQYRKKFKKKQTIF